MSAEGFRILQFLYFVFESTIKMVADWMAEEEGGPFRQFTENVDNISMTWLIDWKILKKKLCARRPDDVTDSSPHVLGLDEMRWKFTPPIGRLRVAQVQHLK